MKNRFKVLMIVSILALTLSTAAHAGGKAGDLPPDNSSAELNRIKSLAGRWTTVTSMFGKKNQRMFTEYKVTAGGSAVEERIFPGTPQEMISVYYDDNGKLAMTHYCIMRNRPTLKLANSSADMITMDVKKIEGLTSKKDPSMGGLTIHFKDKNHFQTTCKAKGKGKENEAPMTTEWTRLR